MKAVAVRWPSPLHAPGSNPRTAKPRKPCARGWVAGQGEVSAPAEASRAWPRGESARGHTVTPRGSRDEPRKPDLVCSTPRGWWPGTWPLPRGPTSEVLFSAFPHGARAPSTGTFGGHRIHATALACVPGGSSSFGVWLSPSGWLSVGHLELLEQNPSPSGLTTDVSPSAQKPLRTRVTALPGLQMATLLLGPGPTLRTSSNPKEPPKTSFSHTPPPRWDRTRLSRRESAERFVPKAALWH